MNRKIKGITAEGDARVLCAKVTKELMEILQKGTYTNSLKPIVSISNANMSGSGRVVACHAHFA